MLFWFMRLLNINKFKYLSWWRGEGWGRVTGAVGVTLRRDVEQARKWEKVRAFHTPNSADPHSCLISYPLPPTGDHSLHLFWIIYGPQITVYPLITIWWVQSSGPLMSGPNLPHDLFIFSRSWKVIQWLLKAVIRFLRCFKWRRNCVWQLCHN